MIGVEKLIEIVQYSKEPIECGYLVFARSSRIIGDCSKVIDKNPNTKFGVIGAGTLYKSIGSAVLVVLNPKKRMSFKGYRITLEGIVTSYPIEKDCKYLIIYVDESNEIIQVDRGVISGREVVTIDSDLKCAKLGIVVYAYGKYERDVEDAQAIASVYEIAPPSRSKVVLGIPFAILTAGTVCAVVGGSKHE